MNIHERIEVLRRRHEALITRRNMPVAAEDTGFATFRFAENGIYEKYRYPVLTAEPSIHVLRMDSSKRVAEGESDGHLSTIWLMLS